MATQILPITASHASVQFSESALRSTAPPEPIEPRVQFEKLACAHTNLPWPPVVRPMTRSKKPYERPLRTDLRGGLPRPIASVESSTLFVPTRILSTPPPQEFSKKHVPMEFTPAAVVPPRQIPTPVPSPEQTIESNEYDRITCVLSSPKKCISCGSSQSPCWRPSWSPESGQLCNSCGLRYKKTGVRCISPNCGKIPSKSEWNLMARSDGGKKNTPGCLRCGGTLHIRGAPRC